MKIYEQCDREDCFAHTGANRYKNCCTVLAELPEDLRKCEFYKSKGQVKDEREKMRRRAENDAEYRALLEEYGIKFAKRGRKNG